MKRPTMLVKAMLRQAALDLDLSVERDIERIRCRCEHEGLSFLTITLPTLSDALERGLEAGSFTCPSSFARHGRLPRFLGGFFKRVFNKDGELLPEPCPDVIYWIRQICRFFKKLKIECSPARNKQAIANFLAVEGELRVMTAQVERKDLLLDEISGIIWSQVFPEIDYLDLVCHHGPGVTADRILSNERHRISRWYTRSEHSFPSDLHCYPNYGLAADAGITREGIGCAEGLDYLKIRDELPVRVVFVPKTQTAPRVIAIEPSNVQYMQQSLKDHCYRILEAHPLTRNSVRFTRQDVNRRLAYESSIDRRLATLDLKDASDRVHSHLVRRIFKTSGILDYLEDSRSLHATLPNEKNLVLTKFASMGSAMCFPVEAMVFYTLVQVAMHTLDGRRPSSRSIREYSRKIDIYGDDIIVPVEYTDTVVNVLESYALRVNVNKSFRYSNFRESCGADYFKGTPVNPVYARQVPHDDSRNWTAETVMSWNATADLFYMRGKWVVAEAIRSMLTRVVRRTIPKTSKLGSGLAFFSYLYTTDLFYDKNLQGWKQKRLTFVPIKRKDTIDGDELACLNKWGYAVHSRNSASHSGYTHPAGLHSHVRSEGRSGLDGCHDSGHCQCGVGCEIPGTDTCVGDGSICSGSSSCENEGTTCSSIQPMAVHSYGPSTALCAARPRFDFSEDYCLTEKIQSDPLLYLHGRTEGLDFETSTKRGGFKSKHRWVSLAG